MNSMPISSISQTELQRLFRNMSLFVLLQSIALFVVAVALFMSRGDIGSAVFAIGELLAVIGSVATILLLPRVALRHATLPLLGSSFCILILYTLIFHPLATLFNTTLAVIIIFSALVGDRQLTFIIGILMMVSALLLSIFSSFINIAVNMETILPIISILAPVSIISVIWFVVDRLMAFRDRAVLLASQRAAEAERAQAASEQARNEAEARADEQQRLIQLVQTLELPILTVGPTTLAVPLIGALSSQRLEAIGTKLLNMVALQRAQMVVFDLTGIAEVDAETATGLLAVAQAVKLLGAATILSGVSPVVAMSLVSSGVDLNGFTFVNNLQSALLETTTPTH